MFCCAFFFVLNSFAIILMGKRELVTLQLYTLIISNALLFNAALSLDYELPQHLQRKKLYTVIF